MIYHLRALRHSRGRWAPFRRELASWLADWRPPEKKLLLVGPSAGYSLPPEFLARFEEITAIEPDRMAPWLFNRRFHRPVTWERVDYFGDLTQPARFAALLAKYPGHAVLFCNLLGQLRFLPRMKDRNILTWFAQLPRLLEGRSFASYHDRLSGAFAPTEARLESPIVLRDEDLIERLYDYEGEDPVELLDHLTSTLFPGLPRTYLHWQLGRRAHHLIEAVHTP